MPVLVVSLLCGCAQEKAPEPKAGSSHSSKSYDPAAWLVGSVDERFALVGKHLRGFDVAMAEVGYRYGELCWASKDRNWDYARYQLSKLETVVRQAVERRPSRGKAAQMLDGAAGMVGAAIERRDAAAMDSSVTVLTATCNACHHASRVPFIHVEPPTERHSPVRPEQTPGGAAGP